MSHHILTVTAPDKWLGTNQRHHFHQRAITTRTWRGAAAWAAKAQHLPKFGMGPVTITATVHRSDARKFDLDGIAPTVKACIDGLRDAGVLAEDHWGVITELTIRRGEQWADAALVLTITEQKAVACMSNNDEGAREALVEQLAEAIEDSLSNEHGTFIDDATPTGLAFLVSRDLAPLVAAQVEAAVSVVRAEVDLVEQDLREVEADARALREKVARVEALAAEFTRRQQRNAAHNGGVVCSVWGLAGGELSRALSDPTTPDQEGAPQ